MTNKSESGTLFFTIGLPRSGKSTFAKDWMVGRYRILENNKYVKLMDYQIGIVDVMNPHLGRAVVNADTIRLNLYGQRFCDVGEPFVHAVKDCMIRSLLNYGHDVLVDGTHTSEYSRKALYKIDPNAQYVLIDTPAATCKERAIECGQEDLLPVIDRMSKQLYDFKNKASL